MSWDEKEIKGALWADEVVEPAAAPAAKTVDVAEAVEQAAQDADVPVAQNAEQKKTDAELAAAVKGKLDVKDAEEGEDEEGWKQVIGEALGKNLIYDLDENQIQVQQADPHSPLYSVKSWGEIAHLEDMCPIPEGVLQAIKGLDWKKPSQIQEAALPLLLRTPRGGKPDNMIFQSQAGTGKTGAFGITMLSRCDPNVHAPQAICLAPTFNLCAQIKRVLEKLAEFTGLKISVHHGGVQLARGERIKEHVVIITPGKLNKYLALPPQRRPFDANKVRVLVLDEADELVDDGFRDNMMSIKKKLPVDSMQMILLSATFEEHVMEFAETYVPSPFNKITLPRQEVTVDNVKQMYIMCNGDAGKFQALEAIYDNVSLGQTLIFVYSKRTADALGQAMQRAGHSVAVLHGSMEKADQDTLLNRYRAGTDKVLICTNILSRGIDVKNVSMVVNYDLPIKHVVTGYDERRNPADCDTYLHRIGRTGRFGKKGSAISLVDSTKPLELERLKVIEKYWGREIKQISVDDEDELEEQIQRT